MIELFVVQQCMGGDWWVTYGYAGVIGSRAEANRVERDLRALLHCDVTGIKTRIVKLIGEVIA